MTLVFARFSVRNYLWIFIMIVSGRLIIGANGFLDFQFLVEPSDTIVIKETSSVLNCSTTAQASEIKWKKDGTILDIQAVGDDRRVILPNGSLLIKRIIHSRTKRPDEGLYQCIAIKNNVGTIVSKEAKLQFASLPTFDESPTDTVVSPDQSVYFPCSIHAVPSASIQWYKNQQPLQLDETRMSFLPSGALELDSVQPSDEGTYHCVAENAEKSRESKAGTLFVNKLSAKPKVASPHFVATPHKSSVVIKGSNLTLDCAANAYPKPTITWLKDGATIDLADLDSKFRIVGSGSLLLENIEEEDAGTYMCRAENSEDSVDASTTLDVLVPPYFVQKLSNQYIHEKKDVIFKCNVYGQPFPIIRWYKDGDNIVHSEYFQILNDNSLKIVGAIKSDSGIYQCFATNSGGNIQSSAQLQVIDTDASIPTVPPSLYFPNIPGELMFHKDAPSAPFNVTAIIVNTRFITLSWKQPLQKNGDILYYMVYYREANSSRERTQNVTRPHLEDTNIQGLQPDTNYMFRVVAYNQHGPGKFSKEIFVQTLPDVHVPNSPNSLVVFPYNSTSVSVKWSPPEKTQDTVDYYQLHYLKTSTSMEHIVNTTTTFYDLHDLKKFAKYTFWVTAYNKNGPGLNTEEITVQTYSDKPSATPQNVTLEPASSTSIVVRWDPPPSQFQNGIITGYKMRVKRKNGNGETITTDGNRRLYTLIDLEKGSQYMIKIAALSVNGSGPYTDWKLIETYSNDLVENKVPDMPSNLRVRPAANSITVSWGPPRDQTTIVRGYKIGYGINLADVYMKNLDGKQRYFLIANLQPSSEYVISLRAYNELGDGRPIYETVKTEVESTPEPFSPMLPPVGLKAIVLSSSTVVLYWTDTTLSRNQVVTDSRYYTIRYTSYTYSSAPKYRYFNSTDLNCMIDDLKPNTQYEFSVRVVKGRKESTWSMSVLNTTQEAAPSSPPRDLTVVASEDDNSQVNLHWQPPKHPNGHITGYVLFYTTDKTQRDRDWVVEGIVGDKMTAIIKGLSTDTTYYFKIQARNNKGYGPLSSEISFHTAAGIALASGSTIFDNKGFANNMLYIIITCVSTFTLLIVIGVSIVVVCRQKRDYLSADGSKSYKSAKANLKNKNVTKDLVPPDLWIHHDQMELKSLDKSNNSHVSTSSLQRNSQELGHEPLLSTLEKKKSMHLDSINDDLLPASEKCIVKCRQIRAKPIKIPLSLQNLCKDSSVISSTSSKMNPCSYDMGTNSLGRPMYPRTQYNIHRNPAVHDGHQNVILGDPPPPPPVISRYSSSSYDVSKTDRSVSFIPTVHEKQEHSDTLTKTTVPLQPLRSFTTLSASSSVPVTPLSKHVAVKTPLVVSSPHKKVVIGEIAKPVEASQQSSLDEQSSLDTIQPADSTEHLNKEMANLEGIMKDLNAITASEFEC